MALSPPIAVVLRLLQSTSRQKPKTETQVYLELLQLLPDLENENENAGMDLLEYLAKEEFIHVWDDPERHNTRFMALAYRGRGRLPEALAMAS